MKANKTSLNKVTVKTKIASCKQCPFLEEGPRHSTDGFDSGNDWICKHEKTKNKMIAGFVEWHEVNTTPIPDWCPIKINRKERRN